MVAPRHPNPRHHSQTMRWRTQGDRQQNARRFDSGGRGRRTQVSRLRWADTAKPNQHPPGSPVDDLAAIGTVESDNGNSTLPGVQSWANSARDLCANGGENGANLDAATPKIARKADRDRDARLASFADGDSRTVAGPRCPCPHRPAPPSCRKHLPGCPLAKRPKDTDGANSLPGSRASTALAGGVRSGRGKLLSARPPRPALRKVATRLACVRFADRLGLSKW
jgi:hypothetical protein